MALTGSRFVLLIALLHSLAVIATGQTASSQTVNPPAYDGARESIDGAHVLPIPGASFSARVELETAKSLADGSTVTHHTFNIIARDFRGRTHNEFRQWNNPTTGADAKLTYALLYDPDTRTRTYLYPASRLARQYVYAVTNPTAVPLVAAANNPMAPAVQKEALGTKFSDGLQLTGIRETKTYPAGSLGNDKPLAITNEYWYSPDLQLNISVTRTDPRFGVQTVQLIDLRRDEPDAVLFEIPADYRVVNESGASSVAAPTAPSDLTIGEASAAMRIRMGGSVLSAKLIDKVAPEYPQEARASRIEGTVRLHAVIEKDGTVQSLELVSGHPLLVKASIDAVRQWRYQPTLLNGNPVEVDTTIDVIFTLNRAPTPAT